MTLNKDEMIVLISKIWRLLMQMCDLAQYIDTNVQWRQADTSVRSAHCYNIVNYSSVNSLALLKYNVVVIPASSISPFPRS